MEDSTIKFAGRILSSEVQDFIRRKSELDLSAVALSKNPFPEIPWTFILNQISGRKATAAKLPTWHSTTNIIFPDRLPLEQSSSEEAARYKSGLFSGKSLIDLTGGFGVDSYYFSRRVDQVVYCEQNRELMEIATHNFTSLGATNITTFNEESFGLLNKLGRKFDWIYVDPARRNESKGKVFMLADCAPDVPSLLDEYFVFARNILVKTSPVLDISAAISELKNVRTVHVVAVRNEVKELLFHLEHGFKGTIEIAASNILKDNIQRFCFKPDAHVDAIFSAPKGFLYEPNAAIMKSGGFDQVSEQYNIAKLHVNSHLYTSNEVLEFPGRRFHILERHPYTKESMKRLVKENPKLNVTCRNFFESAPDIYKRWKIQPGGEKYCFFTTTGDNEKIVLLCSKIE